MWSTNLNADLRPIPGKRLISLTACWSKVEGYCCEKLIHYLCIPYIITYVSLYDNLCLSLQHTFAAGQMEMGDIPTDSHTHTSGKGLEDAFNLVVFVFALCLYVQVHERAI